MEQMYSLKSAAKLLDISPGEVRSLGQKAGILFYVVGDSTRVSESGLSQLISYSPSHDNNVEPLLSLASAAIMLDVSVKTLRKLIRAQNVPVYLVGTSIRIKHKDLSLLIKPQRSLEDY